MNLLTLIFQAVRILHWAKNLLIFVALILAHKVGNTSLMLDATLAFLSFSLCASSVYLFNDLLDKDADKHHPTKKNRPFASGKLKTSIGIGLIPILLMFSVIIAWLLPENFRITLLAYVILTTIYSLGLKSIVLLDVLTLAGLYTLRIAAGAFAIDVPLSSWLLVFSMFLFFSLAMVKRHSELYNLALRNEIVAKGRDYSTNDIGIVLTLGATSGYIAVLVLALYISDPGVTTFYSNPEWLWIVCPVTLYWVSRIWIFADRGLISEDPVLFAMHDKTSYFIAFITLLSILLAV